MRGKTNKIGAHFLALGASIVVNAALVHGFLASRTDPWPTVFADAAAKPSVRPSAATAQPPATDHVERIVVIAKRPGARDVSDGVAMVHVPMPRSRDCPVPL